VFLGGISCLRVGFIVVLSYCGRDSCVFQLVDCSELVMKKRPRVPIYIHISYAIFGDVVYLSFEQCGI
jgi:hypothetical protein